MKVVEPPSGGPRGKGRIDVLSNNRVQATITDREEKTEQYLLEYSQGVNMVQYGKWQLQSVDDVFLQLTDDRLDIQFIRPRNGVFFVKFSGFGAEEGEPPTIRYYQAGRPFQGAKWENPERYAMFALYEALVAGPYAGMEIMDMVTYEFEWDDDLEDFAIIGTKKKWHNHFITFLNVFGFDLQHDRLINTGMQYDAGGPSTIINVLPQLGDILRERNKLAQVTLKDGWVQDTLLQPGPIGMTPERWVSVMSQSE